MNIINTYVNNNTNNYTPSNRGKSDIKWIVIHYTANPGSTAAANAQYYGYGNTNGVSAHYFVDKTGIYTCVREKDIAGHCGKWAYSEYLTECRNANSIGIEMCCHSLSGKKAAQLTGHENDLYIDEQTMAYTIELVKDIMIRYNIDTNHIIRHYDVHTGRKMCPRPFVGDDMNIYYKKTGNQVWQEFKKKLTIPSSTPQVRLPQPQGYLDQVTMTTISGWAYDGTDESVLVHVYIYDASGKQIALFATDANKYRADLKSAGIGNGYHAFSAEYNFSNLGNGTYIVKTFGINKNGGVNPMLNNTKTIEVRINYKMYTVKSGDTLWGIAQRELGNGNRYPEIREFNKLTNDYVTVGQVLKIPM